MAEKNFALTPSVNISRSKFLRTNTHKTSFNLGSIIPIYTDEVLPGDTRSIDVASLIRMSTPIAPIMDDIEMELFAFFVPNRIVWKNWKQFLGESPTAGYSTWSGSHPNTNFRPALITTGCIGDYFGLPFGSSTTDIKVSALQLRGYLSIYNRWFRDQNVESECYVDQGDGFDGSTNSNGVAYNYYSQPLVAYKKSDYYTRALPYAQKSLPVTLPLGALAPLKAVGGASNMYDFASATTPVLFGDANAAITGSQGLIGFNTSGEGKIFSTGATAAGDFASTNLFVDLSKATAATINELRQAFQLQKLLEHDSLYGTRYWELLYGHFGVRAPDASLQDPEYLGGMKFMINVDQVLQTSETSTTALGTPGANSVTGQKGSLFTKSFCEHGYIYILGVARQRQHTYSQGVQRMWRRFNRYDYYWPEFANLGAQEILNREIYADGSANDDGTFGYQEAWADYRYKPSTVSGLLNPNRTGSLNYWTLADRLPSLPSLSASFLKETRDNLKDALVTGVTGPDFIADFYFQDTAVRPMPLYSIPGLIDHH